MKIFSFSHFFIDRPIFATVLSFVITIVGAIALWFLPVSEYPEIAPPTVSISASYPGASSEVIAATVATPIEQEVNGVDNMLYISSQSTGDGRLSINVVFKPGTDIDKAQIFVQNRVSAAEPRLPQEVRSLGISVRKASPDLMMVIHMISPDGSRDQQYISNYTSLYVKDVLSRVNGVGNTTVFGARDFSMRIWLDPAKVAARNLTGGEVIAALRAANVQVAAGSINQPPAKSDEAFQISVSALGRLSGVEQFENIIIRTEEGGGIVRVRDIARVELGSQDYTMNSYINNKNAVAVGVYQRPGSNALATAATLKATMVGLSNNFPPGVQYRIVYNPTDFIQESVDAVVRTLIEAIILVVLVVIIFLQTWRAAVIPIIAIPVSLIGTFGIMAILGISLNTLSLFGLVLAIGIVVDDAIVVVENVERYLKLGLSPKDAAYKTMDEVGAALIAIALVLGAVFIPTAFISGIQGAFFSQFAVTIAGATAISALVSLTLSPALAARLLQKHQEYPHSDNLEKIGFYSTLVDLINKFFSWFNHLFEKLSEKYSIFTAKRVRDSFRILLIYGALLLCTVGIVGFIPTGLIPQLDRGYLITAIQLPPGSSLQRTDAVLRKATDLMLSRPGVQDVISLGGLDGATFTLAPNTAVMFIRLKDFNIRKQEGLTIQGILQDLRMQMFGIKEAFALVIEPPSVPGVGTGGGLKAYIEDRGGRGLKPLEEATWKIAMIAGKMPGILQSFTLFNTRTPEIFVDIDRTKSELLGVPLGKVFEAMSVYMGSLFVNDFNLLGRTFRVVAQSDNPYRLTIDDIANLKTKNISGDMVPIGAVANFENRTNAYRVPRYNLYPAAEVQFSLAPGFSSGVAIKMIEKMASAQLPDGFALEWTELALFEKLVGSTAMIVFGLAILFVFLVLAAMYESWVLPLSIILIVPMCIFASLIGVSLQGMNRNVLVDIGLVVLVGLAAKNAILIVEFAKQAENEGKNRFEAAIEAARTRLRPILMTSLAFILGVIPLVVTSGAGAEMRKALGVSVFYGMIGVTLFGLIFTPVFYVTCRSLGEIYSRLMLRFSRQKQV